ncbi:hypothetical protein ACGFI9_10045 [Micromonospora sp. NPDC048930]|uniref:hypothetical protein n=1 Tax=Micromonospora sp. NPDC048930 TaxID=3364261 RepID=UPI00371396E8
MWEPLAASMVGLTAAAMLIAPTPAPPVDATPVLTTTPFGALPGQQVTHTVTISGTATLTAGRITFTTTADLDDVTVHATPGQCEVSPRTVTCDLGDVRLAAGAAPPRITITGRIRAGADPGGLVRNRVTLTAAEFADDDAQVASNAYLLPGSEPTSGEVSRQAATLPSDPPHRRSAVVAALAVLLAGALVVAAVLLARRRRPPGEGPPPQVPPPVAAGRPDPM